MAININPAHKGLLHKDLHVKQGKKISASLLDKALHSKSPAVRKRANFAKVARTWSHK